MTGPTSADLPYEVVGDLSASRWKSFDACPRAYDLDRKRVVGVGPWAATGLLAHAAMERLGRVRLQQPPAFRLPATPKEVRDVLRALGETHGAAKGPDGVARLREAEAILVDAAPAIAWTHAHALEERHTFALGDRTASVRWDRVDLEPAGVVHVIDWKTGEDVLGRADMLEDPQVGLYLVAARARFPEAREILLTFNWLSRDLRLTVAWTAELDRRVREAASKAVRRLESEAAWAPTTHSKCSACPHRGDCPAYLDLVRGPGGSALVADKARRPLPALPTDELAHLSARLGVLVKLATEARHDVNRELAARLDRRETLEAGDYRVRMQHRQERAYGPVEDVAATLFPLFPDVPEAERLDWLVGRIATVSKRRLEELLARLPEADAARALATLDERKVTVDASQHVVVRPMRKAF